MEEIHISGLELQRWPLELVISSSEIFLLGFGSEVSLANSFWDHEIQILFRVMNFQDIYVFPTLKSKNIFLKHLPQKIKFLFCSNSFFIFLVDFFIFLYGIQHCFICRPSDSSVPTDAGIEPRTVATGALTVRRSNH
jgi:hypothetical protein